VEQRCVGWESKMAWKYTYKGKPRLAYHKYQIPFKCKPILVDARKIKNIKSDKDGFIIIK